MCGTAYEAEMLFISKEIEWREQRIREIDQIPLAEMPIRTARLRMRLQNELDKWRRRANYEFRKHQSSRGNSRTLCMYRKKRKLHSVLKGKVR